MKTKYVLAAAVTVLSSLFANSAVANPNATNNPSGIHSGVTSLLITAFKPFAGSFYNKSAQTAQVLKRSFATYLPDIYVEVCILPVEYDRASDELFKCLNRMRVPAQRIISLGEKATPVVRVETQAANWDDEKQGADEAGVWRQGSTIVPQAAPVLRFSGFPIQAMMNRIQDSDRSKIVLSSDMDNFVCNNTAFRTELRLRGKIPFMFVHVPNGYSPNNDPHESARLILQLRPWM